MLLLFLAGSCWSPCSKSLSSEATAATLTVTATTYTDPRPALIPYLSLELLAEEDEAPPAERHEPLCLKLNRHTPPRVFKPP